VAVDIFLKLDGIDGESTKSKAEGWIEIQSFSNGVSNHSSGGSGTGHGTGKADVSSISFQKVVDKASPKLFLNCCQGTHIAKGTVQVRESTGGSTTETYYQYDMEAVYVDSVSWGGAAGGGKPSESLSLSFQKITISYWPQDATGKIGSKIPAGWDVSKNQKI
jgi:type VI secretion system secreted protein Hcp